VLAIIGMYGVISYSVAQRTREFGIRMALGAPRKDVLGMVLIQAARLTAVGMILGLVAALGVGRIISNFLYGVKPADPFTFITVPLLLLVMSLFACYVPARRATQVAPVIALRSD
jgi:ABC-type antimicrobial peptide transport system permease subunit